MIRWVALPFALGTIGACGSTLPPPEPRPLPPTPARAAPRAEQPDLSPVPEPASLLLVARLKRDALGRLPLGAELGPAVASPLAVMAPALESALGDLVSPEAIELAVALDSPEAILLRGADVAWSIPLTSYRSAHDAIRALPRLTAERRGPGVVAVSDDAGLACLLAASAGPAPARLICGSRRGAVDALGSYLARSLPTRELGPDPVVVEAWPDRFARPHRAALHQAARFLAPKTGRGLDAALSVLADDAVDLLADARRLRLVVRERGGGLELELTAEIPEQTAWISRVLSTLPPPSAGLGELWSRLPADTQAAWFFAAATPARSDEARAAFANFLADEVGTGVPRATLDLVAKTFVQRAPHLHAHGDGHGRDAGMGFATGRALWEHTRSTYGWHVFGFDEPARAYVPELDRGMRDYNAGPLRTFAYRALPRLCEGLGKIKKKRGPPTLPAGSWVYELPLPGRFYDACVAGRTRVPAPAPDDALVVVVVPWGERTFVGLGLGEREMVERMRALAAPRADGPKLEDPAARLGGFVTLAGLGGLMRFGTMHEHRAFTRSRLGSLPNRGATRARFSLAVEPGTPGRTVVKVELPAELLVDLQATNEPSLRKRW
ncbi:MAG: hypothetical protein HYZ29_10715 [Myxococcales bacterium]|nr:hypothetical protein [Myxococcales bacterium]